MRQHLERDELRYAIWLDVETITGETIIPIMNYLRQRCNGPWFPPHLTLTSGISGDEAGIIDRFKALASDQPPFTLQPQGLRISGDFFRAITVATDLPAPLQAFRQHACQIYGLQSEKPYHPHLSLVYGELSDELLAIIRAELTAHEWPPLPIVGCSLWRLKGPVSNWRKVSDAALTG